MQDLAQLVALARRQALGPIPTAVRLDVIGRLRLPKSRVLVDVLLGKRRGSRSDRDIIKDVHILAFGPEGR